MRYVVIDQHAADELGGDQLGGAGEEGLGEVLVERGGYGSGYGRWVEAIDGRPACRKQDAINLLQQGYCLACIQRYPLAPPGQ